MAQQRNICVVTGTRAEYGLLSPFMKLVKGDPGSELQVLVTGMHLAPEFGETWRQIESDGFPISAKVAMLLSSDTACGVAMSTGVGLMGCARELERLRPDLAVVLGDRFETFAAVTACLFLGIPVVHFHGGEATFGAFDDSLRHSITKMAHLHFTATEEYRRRVVQLGEDPGRVFRVGALGLDAIEEARMMDRGEFEESIGFRLMERNAVVTFHPETVGDASPGRQFNELLRALEKFPDLGIIFTYPNADTGGRDLIRQLEEYVARKRERACGFPSLGRDRYFSALRHCDLVIGNSSSGIIEAPAFQIPTVNIGSRQEGRVRGDSVIDIPARPGEIVEAIGKALSPEFREIAAKATNPYGTPGAAGRAFGILKEFDLRGITKKRFHNILWTEKS